MLEHTQGQERFDAFDGVAQAGWQMFCSVEDGLRGPGGTESAKASRRGRSKAFLRVAVSERVCAAKKWKKVRRGISAVAHDV